MRNGHGHYGEVFQGRVERLGLEQVVIAARSPWQNAYVERFIGSLRRECLDHVIALDECQLMRVVRSYAEYQPERDASLAREASTRAPVCPRPLRWQLVAVSEVGGLQHRYERRAAA